MINSGVSIDVDDITLDFHCYEDGKISYWGGIRVGNNTFSLQYLKSRSCCCFYFKVKGVRKIDNYCGIETDYNEIEKAVKEWLEKQPWVTSEDIQVELNSIEETGEGYEEIANKQWIRRDKLLEALSL
jgi:hypothetical protein